MKSIFKARAIAASLIAVGFLISPVFASAQTVTLQQQLENLLAQIATLQASASTSAAVSAPAQSVMPESTSSNNSAQAGIICPTFARTLSLGSSGTDVANLQGFLAQNPLIYPEGRVTAYFGLLTQDAVERWQTAYHIVSSGTPSTTGYGTVGSRTRAAISASCESQVNPSASQSFVMPSQQALCPIASQPATPCAGTWSPLTNATGCTVAWQCAVPLPGATTTVQSSVTPNATTTASCEAYTLPLCTGGTDQWLGMSSNGCNLGYQCVQ